MGARSSGQFSFWGMALVSAVCLGFEARVSAQSLVIQQVTIEGTERPLQLQTKNGQLLERRRVALDVKRLWATGWFDDIRVLTESTPEGAEVRFVLAERPRYLLRKVRFEPRHFELRAQVIPGFLVDKSGLVSQARAFQERLRDSGYRDAIVNVELIPAGIRQADVLFRVDEGRRYVVDRLEASGVSPSDSRRIAEIIRDIRPRTLLPGIPRVWKGWKLRAPLNQEALDLALQRLRSDYISRGYLDATASLESVGFEDNRASIFLRVLTGASYRLEEFQVSDSLTPNRLDSFSNQLSVQQLCRCLVEKRDQAERLGVIDFGVSLVAHPRQQTAQDRPENSVSLVARTETGPSYRVRRIEFRGHHRFSDLTLRKVLVISEGEPFNKGLLRRSLTRLNSTRLVHPVSESDVNVKQDSALREVELVISVRERDRGRWSLGAPAWAGFSRTSWLSVGSQLPSWEPSGLELPTYFAALNLASFPLSILNPAHYSITLARPFLPGKEWWKSGLQVSPQSSWPQMLLASGLLQTRPRLEEWLQTNRPLQVPVRWGTGSSEDSHLLTTGTLICHSQPKSQARLFGYFRIAADVLLAAGF